MGRFLSRDPIGVWGDAGNFGNGYGYVGNNPLSFKDSNGLRLIIDKTVRKEALKAYEKISGLKLDSNKKGEISIKKDGKHESKTNVHSNKLNKQELSDSSNELNVGRKLVEDLIKNKNLTIVKHLDDVVPQPRTCKGITFSGKYDTKAGKFVNDKNEKDSEAYIIKGKPGKGTDALIGWDPNDNRTLGLQYDIETGKLLVDKSGKPIHTQDPAIVLVHESFHAVDSMKGLKINLNADEKRVRENVKKVKKEQNWPINIYNSPWKKS